MSNVQASLWSGVPVVRLTDNAAGVTALIAPQLGANLFSLTDGGRELLRCPPDAATLAAQPTRWGIPVLLPPSRIDRGRFRFGGREYQLEIDPKRGHHSHGWLLRRPWEVVETGADSRVTIEFRSTAFPEVMAQFPHPFRFRLTYTLQGRSLRCDAWIANEGAEPMPFGLGFHPYFAAAEESQARYEMRLPHPAVRWEQVDGITTGRFYEPEGLWDLTRWQPVHAIARDGGYRLTARGPDGWSRCEIADRVSGRIITVTAGPEFGHWVIFNGGAPGFSGFICAEPYTCMGNAFNLDVPHAVSGMQVIAGGEARSAGTWTLAWTKQP